MRAYIAQLEAIRKLYSAYECCYHDETFVFDIVLSDVVLNLLAEHEIEFTLNVDGKYIRESFYQNQIGKRGSISIEKDSLYCGRNIYVSWDDFFEFKANLLVCPDFFWIIADDLFFHKEIQSEIKSSIFNNYLEVCSLINLLIKLSDYQDKLSDDVVESVIFLHKSKLEVPTWYKFSELAEGLDGISVVLSMFHDELHREHKVSIFKEVLYSLLSNVPKDKRLEYLFEHFGEFSTRLTDNYQLFVSEFSFDSVRAEYEEKKRDYIIKLNDVLASVQTKMLGIPVSLGFLSLKFDSNKVDNVVISDHIALSAGIVIYCIMMFLLIINQFHTLNAVKDEYRSLMRRLKFKHADQHDKIKGIVENLDGRYRFQWWTLLFFNVVTILLLFSLFYFI